MENNTYDEMNLTEFMELYKERERKVQELDYQNLSDEDRQLLSDFADMKTFRDKLENAFDFVNNSTVLLMKEDPDKGMVKSLETLTSKEEYVSQMKALTNNFDKDFVEFININKNSFDRQDSIDAMNTVLQQEVIKQELERQQREKNEEEIRLAEAKAAQEKAEEERRQREISEEKTGEDTFNKVVEMTLIAGTTVLAVEAVQEMTKEVTKLNETKELAEKAEREKASADISVSAEIADDGHAVIKNIEGEGKEPVGKEVDKSEIANKVEEKINEVKQDIQETVANRAEEVAPRSEQAMEDRAIDNRDRYDGRAKDEEKGDTSPVKNKKSKSLDIER